MKWLRKGAVSTVLDWIPVESSGAPRAEHSYSCENSRRLLWLTNHRIVARSGIFDIINRINRMNAPLTAADPVPPVYQCKPAGNFKVF